MANQNELEQLLVQAQEELRRLGHVTKETADAIDAGGKARLRELQQSTALLGGAFGSVKDAAFSVGKAMLDGKKGASAFNSALDDMAKAAYAAGAALTFLIPGGPVIKMVVAAFSAVAATAFAANIKLKQAANEMADSLYKGYSGLAKSGAIASDGMTGLFKDAEKLGLSMSELDSLVNVVTQSSKEFALFSGSVIQGRKTLASMGGELEKNRENFLKMGMSMTDVTDALGGYMRMQTAYGRTQKGSVESMAKAAKDYIYEQDILTKLTGMSRKELEDKRQADLSEEMFGSMMMKLQLAADRGDEASKMEMERIQDLVDKSRLLGEDTAKGIRGAIVGNLQDPATQRLMRTGSSDILATSAAVRKGTMSSGDMIQNTAQNMVEAAEGYVLSVGELNASGENFSKIQDIRSAALLRGKNLDEEAAKLKKDREKQEKGQGDKLLDNQAQLINTQIKANKAMENFVLNAVEPTQKSMIKLAEYAQTAAGVLNKLFGYEKKFHDTDREVTKEQKQSQAATEKVAGIQQQIKDVGGIDKASPELKQALKEAEEAERESAVIARQKAADNKRDRAEVSRIMNQRKISEDEAVKIVEQTRNQEQAERKKYVDSQLAVEKKKLERMQEEERKTGPKFDEAVFAKQDAKNYEEFVKTRKELQKQSLDELEARVQQEGRRATSRERSEARAQAETQARERFAGAAQAAGASTGSSAQAARVSKLESQSSALAAPATVARPSENVPKSSGPADKVPDTAGADQDEKAQQTKPSNVKLGPNANLSGMDPKLMEQFYKFAQDYGKDLTVNSAKRDDVKQAELWVRANKLGDTSVKMPARPKETTKVTVKGQEYTVDGSGVGSLHREGKALDVSGSGFDSAQTWVDELLAKSGLKRPHLPGDPPHIAMMADGGITKGPSIAGEAGPEAVIPLKGGKVPVDVRFPRHLLDPRQWENMVKNGLATNYAQSMAGVGSSVLKQISSVMIDQRTTTAESSRESSNTSDLDTVAKSLQHAIDKAIERLAPEKADAVQQEMLEILREINRNQSATADASQRMARAAAN
jgi:hypothetical protein